MATTKDRLAAIGEQLPLVLPPVANYMGCKRSGNILCVSARVSQVRGEVGTDLDLREGQLELIPRLKAS